jgi:hypothetical protein
MILRNRREVVSVVTNYIAGSYDPSDLVIIASFEKKDNIENQKI